MLIRDRKQSISHITWSATCNKSIYLVLDFFQIIGKHKLKIKHLPPLSLNVMFMAGWFQNETDRQTPDNTQTMMKSLVGAALPKPNNHSWANYRSGPTSMCCANMVTLGNQSIKLLKSCCNYHDEQVPSSNQPIKQFYVDEKEANDCYLFFFCLFSALKHYDSIVRSLWNSKNCFKNAWISAGDTGHGTARNIPDKSSRRHVNAVQTSRHRFNPWIHQTPSWIISIGCCPPKVPLIRQRKGARGLSEFHL